MAESDVADLASYFLDNLESEEDRARFENWPTLRHQLMDALEQGQTAWPAVVLEPRAFAKFLAHRALPSDPPELPDHPADLYLAQACLLGDERALRLLESHHLSQLRFGRLGLSDDDASDVLQDLRTRLLVGSAERDPALASYMGTGPLFHWLRAVATRLALGRLRGRRPMANVEDLILEDTSDPLLAQLKERHREDFKAALHAVVAELPARDRMILRALVVDNRSVADVAKLYRVHRVTASRWIAGIRRALFVRTRDRLRASLKLSEGELASMIRMVESQMEMSLERILGSETD